MPHHSELLYFLCVRHVLQVHVLIHVSPNNAYSLSGKGREQVHTNTWDARSSQRVSACQLPWSTALHLQGKCFV